MGVGGRERQRQRASERETRACLMLMNTMILIFHIFTTVNKLSLNQREEWAGGERADSNDQANTSLVWHPEHYFR